LLLAAAVPLAAPAAALAQEAIDPSAALPPTECVAAPAEQFVMPTTGAVFTLPDEPVATPETDCPPLAPPPPVRPPAPSLFRMVAMPIGDNAAARKWADTRLAGLADYPGAWNELLSEARRMPQLDPVQMVNQWVNWHVRYREDERGDEWATAPVTLMRGYGDCEDFALAKMALLAELGISPEEMFLVLLRDARQADHAVLAVNRNGRFHVLDNRTDKVLRAEAIADYTPILSFSGTFAWTYGKRVGLN
jgi:predicted transglutaminase-like cysteine proteinase